MTILILIDDMKIAFYKARHGNLYDKIISIITLSKYSHCEIVFPNGECWSSSSRDGGVRCKFINLDNHWDVFNINKSFDQSTIKNWFLDNNQDSYDWFGAFGSTIRLNSSSENKKFCSYVCAIVLGLNPIITPGSLFDKLKKLKYI